MTDLLKLSLPELIAMADKTRRECAGRRLEICSILNAKSGLCCEDCKFCAQSSHHSTGALEYSLKEREEIVKAAWDAKKIGAEKFGIVTSGNRLNYKEIESIAEAIREINHKVGISVCASLGALTKDDFKVLKDAGLTRYHHNIETSRRFYPHVVTTHTFQERLDTIRAAKEAGLEVCSGGIIGMGETWQDRIDMAALLRDLDVDSVPINLLMPIKGTPFESLKPICCNDAIRAISIFRIILKDKVIKIAAGRETVLKDFQGLGFLAGANGMLIGGYLTVKGRDVKDDYELIREIGRLWEG
jgi:biotin synthase